jgi:hypothetical protein
MDGNAERHNKEILEQVSGLAAVTDTVPAELHGSDML